MIKPKFIHKVWDNSIDMWGSKWAWYCFIIYKYERHMINYRAPWYRIDVLIHPDYDMAYRKQVKVKYKIKLGIQWPWVSKKNLAQ